ALPWCQRTVDRLAAFDDQRADVTAGGVEHRHHLRLAAAAAPVPGLAVLVGELQGQLVDGIRRQFRRARREDESDCQCNRDEEVHLPARLAHRNPRLAVVPWACIEDSMATRISTA